MPDEDSSPDGGNTTDPNTGRELARARNDAKRYREEAASLREETQRLHDEIKAEKKVADGLRGKVQQVQNEAAAAMSERDAKDEATARSHEESLAAMRAKEFDTKAGFETALATSKQERDDLQVTYEMRNAALKAGVVDENDIVKLLDRSSLKLTKDGQVTGLSELIEQAKTDKPYLFVKPVIVSNSSNPAKPPPQDNKPKMARDMTAEEYATSLAALKAAR